MLYDSPKAVANPGSSWCIYPLYDWAHGQEDLIEGVTHSICTLEFENHRELYDWFLDRDDWAYSRLWVFPLPGLRFKSVEPKLVA